ncbi:hypothetical protein ACH5RR_008435 [Cinchona calisaya]|uniref:Thioredoxin domain-containing protein n=1 Tax=Cinchona calisaya TaxID=153742 RepID=A0ABD3AH75_9GENT
MKSQIQENCESKKHSLSAHNLGEEIVESDVELDVADVQKPDKSSTEDIPSRRSPIKILVIEFEGRVLCYFEKNLNEAVDAAVRWNASSVPSFYIIRDGKQVDKVVGADKISLERMIASMLDC